MKTQTMKSIVLEAMRDTLKQYENRTHTLRTQDCPLCRTFYKEIFESRCRECPMFVFDPEDGLSCVDRRCEPVNTCREDYDENRLSAVIVFYVQSIERIEGMTDQEINNTDFQFLKDIDEMVYDTYKHNFE